MIIYKTFYVHLQDAKYGGFYVRAVAVHPSSPCVKQIKYIIKTQT